MTLEELKEYIKSVCLAHKHITQFLVGNDYNQAEGITNSYPQVFYELPYLLNYNMSPSKRVDNVQFAFNVFVESNSDKIAEDHDAISRAKEIGDAIVTYIQENTQDFIILSITALSVREFTDDSVAGIRYEWVISLPRTICDYDNLFDPID